MEQRRVKQKLCVINVVGLTPRLLPHAPRIGALGEVAAWRSPIPAVTATCQATMLTGRAPREHGIVGNGWYFQETAEIRFWQQNNALVQGEKLYQGIQTAKMFWWFNQHAPVRWSATPKPHYGSDGSKVFDILDSTGCDLQKHLGPFPFAAFWGPRAGLDSSQWIARASALVMERNRPELTLVYLPHLDYDYQRFAEHDPARVAEVDACAGIVIDAAARIDARVIVVSEYGLVPVTRPVFLNRHLRDLGWLKVRQGPFGEQLMPGDCDAFAVVDHQVAHIYVQRPELVAEVQASIAALDGVETVVAPAALELDHPRSGQLIAIAQPDAWFAYYFWDNDRFAPDYAPTVDIHRKPGYDPVELFMTSKMRAMLRLAQKKLGMRYRMDVIPLDAALVRGSHGRQNQGPDGPLIVGPHPPLDMRDFKAYVHTLMF